MADAQDDPEVIRRQMEAQRASLADKLDTLEHKIVETVQGAREAVHETVQTVKDSVQSSVETVKETVHSSVETVKETFDVRRQVERHPWAMFGGSIAAGFAAGWLLNRASGGAWAGHVAPSRPLPERYREDLRRSAAFHAAAPSTPAPPAPPPAPRTGPGESWVDQLSHTFAPEVQKVKGLAIGALIGVVRDLVSQSVPDQLRPQLTEVMNNITTKLGGEPMQAHLLDDLLPRRHDDEHNGRHRTPQENYQG